MLLNIDEVVARTRLGKSTIRKLAAQGAFPRARQLVGRRKVWLEKEVTDWLIKTIGEPTDQSRSKGNAWLPPWTTKS